MRELYCLGCEKTPADFAGLGARPKARLQPARRKAVKPKAAPRGSVGEETPFDEEPPRPKPCPTLEEARKKNLRISTKKPGPRFCQKPCQLRDRPDLWVCPPQETVPVVPPPAQPVEPPPPAPPPPAPPPVTPPTRPERPERTCPPGETLLKVQNSTRCVNQGELLQAASRMIAEFTEIATGPRYKNLQGVDFKREKALAAQFRDEIGKWVWKNRGQIAMAKLFMETRMKETGGQTTLPPDIAQFVGTLKTSLFRLVTGESLIPTIHEAEVDIAREEELPKEIWLKTVELKKGFERSIQYFQEKVQQKVAEGVSVVAGSVKQQAAAAVASASTWLADNLWGKQVAVSRMGFFGMFSSGNHG